MDRIRSARCSPPRPGTCAVALLDRCGKTVRRLVCESPGPIFRRDGLAFDTKDHELDIWIDASGSWRWKDEERMDDWVRQGRFTSEDVAVIRAEGERVLAEWPFPTGWEDWQPDLSWAAPTLPQDW